MACYYACETPDSRPVYEPESVGFVETPARVEVVGQAAGLTDPLLGGILAVLLVIAALMASGQRATR